MPHKTTRRLIRVGNTSLAIILPIGWLRYHNLSYGDCLEVISSSVILLKPKKKEEDSEA